MNVKKRLIKRAGNDEEAVLDFYLNLTKKEQQEFLKDFGLETFDAAKILKALPKSKSKFNDELDLYLW